MLSGNINKLAFAVILLICVGSALFVIGWLLDRFDVFRTPITRCFEQFSSLPALSERPSQILWPTLDALTPDNVSQRARVATLTLPDPDSVIYDLAVSPSGRLLAASLRGSGDVIIWNLETMTPIFKQALGTVKFSFRSDEKVVAFYRTDGMMGLIDLEAGTQALLVTWDQNSDSPTNQLAFGRDNDLLFDHDGYISSCNLATHENEELRDSVYLRTLLVNSVRSHFAYATATDRDSSFNGVPILDIWPIDNLASAQESSRMYHGEFEEMMITTTSSTFDSLIATGHGEGKVHIIDIDGSSPMKTLSLPGVIQDLDFNPSENLLSIVYNTPDERYIVAVYDVETQQSLETLEQDVYSQVRFSRDGHLLLMASKGEITLWGVTR